METLFRALMVENADKPAHARVVNVPATSLPAGDTLVKVHYSTLNYKDALAITGHLPVVKQFPMVPGIDLAGEVLETACPGLNAGDLVLLNGFGAGENHWGGLADLARLPGTWLVPVPRELSTWECMALGTAGYTAMLCVMALEKHGITPQSGPVLVTGANGGVGSVAIHILDQLGYRVTASTGRLEQSGHLKELGASEVIPRQELNAPGQPLEKQRWAAAIDSLGGRTLANVCASMQDDGVVAACGLAESMEFPATVAPFILRGVTLAGINCVYRPLPDRITAWRRLAQLVEKPVLERISATIELEEVAEAASHLLEGKVRGRLVVRLRS